MWFGVLAHRTQSSGPCELLKTFIPALSQADVAIRKPGQLRQWRNDKFGGNQVCCIGGNTEVKLPWLDVCAQVLNGTRPVLNHRIMLWP